MWGSAIPSSFCIPLATRLHVMFAAFRHSVATSLVGGRQVAITARSALSCVLVIVVAMACLSCGVCPPAAFISSISPNSTTAGGNQFLLTVNGSDFRRDSVVSWNGSFRVTTFISSRQLLAAITAADIAQPGTVLVFVFTPPNGGTTFVSGAIGTGSMTPCNGKNSNAVSFTIDP